MFGSRGHGKRFTHAPFPSSIGEQAVPADCCRGNEQTSSLGDSAFLRLSGFADRVASVQPHYFPVVHVRPRDRVRPCQRPQTHEGSLYDVSDSRSLNRSTLYSVPPFQFKRIPVMAGESSPNCETEFRTWVLTHRMVRTCAGITIACVRGFLLNFGVYYAVKEALGVPFQWNPSVTFLARFRDPSIDASPSADLRTAFVMVLLLLLSWQIYDGIRGGDCCDQRSSRHRGRSQIQRRNVCCGNATNR